MLCRILLTRSLGQVGVVACSCDDRFDPAMHEAEKLTRSLVKRKMFHMFVRSPLYVQLISMKRGRLGRSPTQYGLSEFRCSPT